MYPSTYQKQGSQQLTTFPTRFLLLPHCRSKIALLSTRLFFCCKNLISITSPLFYLFPLLFILRFIYCGFCALIFLFPCLDLAHSSCIRYFVASCCRDEGKSRNPCAERFGACVCASQHISGLNEGSWSRLYSFPFLFLSAMVAFDSQFRVDFFYSWQCVRFYGTVLRVRGRFYHKSIAASWLLHFFGINRLYFFLKLSMPVHVLVA